jgi:hypothetical protein
MSTNPGAPHAQEAEIRSVRDHTKDHEHAYTPHGARRLHAGAVDPAVALAWESDSAGTLVLHASTLSRLRHQRSSPCSLAEYLSREFRLACGEPPYGST